MLLSICGDKDLEKGLKMNEQIIQAARDLSNLISCRVFILSNGQFIPASGEDLPFNVIAYTWYQVRSKAENKWSIQLVK